MITSMSVWQRVGYLLLGWGCVGFIYSLTGHIYSSAHVISPTLIDDAIGYSPNAIWLYLSFFLFIPCGYLLSHAEKVKPLMWQMILCAVLSGTVYLIYPTTAEFPQYIGSWLTQQALAGLLQVDTSQNMLPSLHVSLTLIAWWALCRKGQFLRNLLWLLWALMIIFSVLMLKRHLFIDVVGGAACAWIAITVVRVLTFRLLAANPSRRVQ
ncbi:TPA: phosphatase PAP2 family protein [Providencia alcalifaciens]|nr:phosphatase PAP2 family protein [Providencia alcalifaciens]HEQ1860254.1 phosphatase PAP2 family protein [Providencia alcalifaciens]